MPTRLRTNPATSSAPVLGLLALPVSSQKAMTGKTRNVKPALKALPGIFGTISGTRPASAMA